MAEILGRNNRQKLIVSRTCKFLSVSSTLLTTAILDPRECDVIGCTSRITTCCHSLCHLSSDLLVKKAEFCSCAYSDPLAREVEILGADQKDRSLRGKFAAFKNKQEEWLRELTSVIVFVKLVFFDLEEPDV